MAKPGYLTEALTLRKTKLGESDLIITMLLPDGSQRQAVAKSARKPSSGFASRLELYSLVDVLCSPGRTLDVVQEARLVSAHENLRFDMELSCAAAPVAELITQVTDVNLENPRLFDATKAVFSLMNQADAPVALGLCAAHLLKILAFVGFRPRFDTCVSCGKPVDLAVIAQVAYSCAEGGVVCASCRGKRPRTVESSTLLRWAQYLLHATFRDIVRQHPNPSISLDVLRLCQTLIREHLGTRTRSLEFLFTSGLFCSYYDEVSCTESTLSLQ